MTLLAGETGEGCALRRALHLVKNGERIQRLEYLRDAIRPATREKRVFVF